MKSNIRRKTNPTLFFELKAQSWLPIRFQYKHVFRPLWPGVYPNHPMMAAGLSAAFVCSILFTVCVPSISAWNTSFSSLPCLSIQHRWSFCQASRRVNHKWLIRVKLCWNSLSSSLAHISPRLLFCGNVQDPDQMHHFLWYLATEKMSRLP
jgi:hypothetical protein